MAKARLLRAVTVLLAWAAVTGGAAAVAAEQKALDQSNAASAQSSDTTSGGTLVAAAPGLAPQVIATSEKVRKSRTIATQLAHMEWLDRMAAVDPFLMEAICAHPGPAAIVAAHPRIAEIADADHFLCRRLTQWHHATEVLLRNPHADHVIELDPQGMYWAIERRPAYARLLAGHVASYDMLNYDPNLGRIMVQHMR